MGRILDKCLPNVLRGSPRIQVQVVMGFVLLAQMKWYSVPTLVSFLPFCKGGWNFKAESQAFTYFTQTKHVVTAGLALAGHSNPNILAHAPSLAAIGTDSRTVARLNAFSGELFNNVGVPELETTLKDYRDVLVASLLMYYNQVKAALGNEPPIIKTMCLASILMLALT